MMQQLKWINKDKLLETIWNSMYNKVPADIYACCMTVKYPHFISMYGGSIHWIAVSSPHHPFPHALPSRLQKHGISETSVCVKISSDLCHDQSPLFLHQGSIAPRSFSSGDRYAFLSDILTYIMEASVDVKKVDQNGVMH